MLSAPRDDDAIDRRIETCPADPRRPRGAIVTGAGMVLLPEDPRAGRARNRCGKTIGELLHIRQRHQRVDGEIEHSLLRPFDLHRTGTDERAAPYLSAQEAAALRFGVRARDRCQRDAELPCEDPLGRQTAAGLQPAGLDLTPDGVGNGLIDRAASCPRGGSLIVIHAICHLTAYNVKIGSNHSGNDGDNHRPSAGGHCQVRDVRAEPAQRRAAQARPPRRAAGTAAADSAALLERPGEVVTREDLCRRLWPEGTFVDFEHSLNAAVRRLRITLGDDADVPRFVETVHKRGYRFLPLGRAHPYAAHDAFRNRSAPATIAHIVGKRARLAVLPFGPHDGFTEG